MATAQMNIGDLCKVLGLPVDTAPSPPQENVQAPRTPFNALRVRRQSMEQLSLIQVMLIMGSYVYRMVVDSSQTLGVIALESIKTTKTPFYAF